MFRNKNLFMSVATLSIIAVLSAACGSATPGGTGFPGAVTPAGPGLVPNTGATAAPGSESQAGAVIVSQNATLGPILTDGKGMTLYIYTKDTAGVSNCTDQCAVTWPPLKASAAAAPDLSAGSSPTESAGTASTGTVGTQLNFKLGTIQRADGTTQVTVNDMPVYYYAQDLNPGDANGQGVGGVWYVLDASGNVVKDGAGAPGTSPAPVSTPMATP
jgi:predicted lipoprotein with Yx(FWY)xxD motif